jgi:hypothetical protein
MSDTPQAAQAGADGQRLTVPDISASTVANAGVRFVKRNPVPSAAYAIGLLLCIFFTGFSLTEMQKRQFYNDVDTVDYEKLDEAQATAMHWNQKYYQTKGFFWTCNDVCQENKREFERADLFYQTLKRNEAAIISDAKSKIGIFSELGVKETREAFWVRYTQGKGFAQRQTKFDAAFFGFRAMLRDESMMEYVITILIRVLFNFTLGVIATVVTFAWSSYSVIQSFQASPLVGLIFFIGALLAALAFAVTWLFLIFGGVGVTAYATIKLAAANVRIEDGGGRRRQHIH